APAARAARASRASDLQRHRAQRPEIRDDAVAGRNGDLDDRASDDAVARAQCLADRCEHTRGGYEAASELVLRPTPGGDFAVDDESADDPTGRQGVSCRAE